MFATAILLVCLGAAGYLFYTGAYALALITAVLGLVFVQAHNAYVTADIVRNMLSRGKYQPPEDKEP